MSKTKILQYAPLYNQTAFWWRNRTKRVL